MMDRGSAGIVFLGHAAGAEQVHVGLAVPPGLSRPAPHPLHGTGTLILGPGRGRLTGESTSIKDLEEILSLDRIQHAGGLRDGLASAPGDARPTRTPLAQYARSRDRNPNFGFPISCAALKVSSLS